MSATTGFTESPVTTVNANGSTCSSFGTLCGQISNEPLLEDIIAIRDSTSCTLANKLVEAVAPGSLNNPQNVQNVENVFPENKFIEFFPNRNEAYTYDNFLKAIAKYPAICSHLPTCPKILANMFAHFQQETAGLFYLEEIYKGDYCADWSAWVVESYPCIPGQKYYGRGAKQLSWNYNYGAFSRAMYGDALKLLKEPDLVATTWLNFAATMWFYVTPQPPKPSMLQVVDGSWVPNSVDMAANLQPGLGASIMILNGALECGQNPSNQNAATNRGNYYKNYTSKLGVDITGEKLDCANMAAFTDGGSAGGITLYWDNTQNCKLVKWQTAFSALVEGDYAKCMGNPDSSGGCNSATTSMGITESEVTVVTESPTTGISMNNKIPGKYIKELLPLQPKQVVSNNSNYCNRI